jgi:hypothetical protein
VEENGLGLQRKTVDKDKMGNLKMSNWMPNLLWVLLPLSVVLISVIAIQNRGNQNVLFATATVVGAIVFYVLQLATSLAESRQVAKFAVEITVDRSTNYIGAAIYSLKQSTRAMAEKEILQNLMETQTNIADQQEAIVLRDFLVVSTLKWLSLEEFDWQTEAKIFKTSHGTISSKGFSSPEGQSETVAEKDMRNALTVAGNVFSENFTAGAFKKIVLPKNSEFVVSTNGVLILNPVFDVKVDFADTPIMVSNVDPRTNQMELLKNGKPHISVFVYEGTFTTIVKKYRSGDSQRPRLEAWFSRLDADIKAWFEVLPFDKDSKKFPLGTVVAEIPD